MSRQRDLRLRSGCPFEVGAKPLAVRKLLGESLKLVTSRGTRPATNVWASEVSLRVGFSPPQSRANSLASNLGSLVSSCSLGKTTMNRILERRYSGVSFNRRSKELLQDCDLI
jgi:hypothetical protein